MSDLFTQGFVAGSTSRSIDFKLRSTTDNTVVTGKVYSDITAGYWRQGGSPTAITTVTLAAINSAYSSGGVKEASSTISPGSYRLDLPDAAIAAGADWVEITVQCAGCYTYSERFALSTNAVQTGDSFVRLGSPIGGVSVSNDLSGIYGALVLRTGTAQGGGSTSITLDAGASSTNDLYIGNRVLTTGGTGGMQSRVITAYNGGTKVATVYPAWATNPDSTTTFAVETSAYAAGVATNVGITQAAADQVWSTTTRALTDKAGFALSSAGVQAIWDALTSALTTAGSVGKRIADFLDATISSRSTYGGADTSGTTTLLGRLTSARATLLDNADVAVSTRLPTSGYTAPPAATDNATAVRTELGTELARIDVATSTRLPTSSYSAPPSAASIAVATVDQSLSGHTTAGTVGGALNAAGSAGDPWSTMLPGSYASGTAGYIVGNRLDVVLSTRLPTSSYSAPPSAATIAATTVDLSLSGHTTAGTVGAALSAASASGDPWTTALPGSYGAGSAGAILAAAATQTTAAAIKAKTDNLPASPAAAADAASALTSAGYTSTRAAKLDNLTGPVMLAASYTVPPTTTQIKAQADQALADAGVTTARTAHLDADISSRFAAGSYVAPDNATVSAISALATAIKAKTDGLPTDPADASDIAAAFAAVAGTLGTLTSALAAVGGDVSGLPAAVWDAALAEDYAAQGAEVTPRQALYMILQLLSNREVVAALLTAYKLDGTTPAMTFTLNDASVPTAQTRAT